MELETSLHVQNMYGVVYLVLVVSQGARKETEGFDG